MIEAKRGWANTVSTKQDYHEILDGLGVRYEALLNTYKPFACGIVMHPAIDAAIQLRNENQLTADQIERVELKVNPLVLELTGKQSPHDGLEGKFSIYHAVAVALVEGAGGEKQFSDRAVNDPNVVELRGKVIPVVTPGIDPAQVDMTIALEDGRTLHRFIAHAIGSVQVQPAEPPRRTSWSSATRRPDWRFGPFQITRISPKVPISSRCCPKHLPLLGAGELHHGPEPADLRTPMHRKPFETDIAEDGAHLIGPWRRQGRAPTNPAHRRDQRAVRSSPAHEDPPQQDAPPRRGGSLGRKPRARTALAGTGADRLGRRRRAAGVRAPERAYRQYLDRPRRGDQVRVCAGAPPLRRDRRSLRPRVGADRAFAP